MSSQIKNRRIDRARAFQVIYSLFFKPASSIRALGSLYKSTLYTGSLPEDWQTVQVLHIEESENGEIRNEPDDNSDELVVTPTLSAETPGGFAWELVLGTWQNQDELDRLITSFSQNWRIERMGKVELALLRLAIYELVFRDDAPPRVVINEAIELAKTFGDDNAHGFVNGILDAAIRSLDNGSIKRGSTLWGRKPQLD